MTDSVWSLIGVGAVAYLIYRWYSKRRPMLTALDGGKVLQFEPVQGPEPGFQGSTPQIAVMSWPGGGGKC